MRDKALLRRDTSKGPDRAQWSARRRTVKKILTALVMVGTVATMALMANDRERELKLQRAIDLVESKGDVAKATPLLEEVAGSPDRALAARALLYLAQAQATQNKEKARATYQRITEQYSDQKDVVAMARARTAAFGPARPSSQDGSPRRVLAMDSFLVRDVSLDGRLVVGFATPATRLTLALWDSTSGQIRALAEPTALARPSLAVPVFSPSGREIAYGWTESVSGKDDISVRVIGTEAGSRPRTVINSNTGAFNPIGWSPDGKALLVADAGMRTVAWASLADGSVRTIASFEPWQQAGAGLLTKVSPDGHYIAFAAAAREGSIDRYIFVMDKDGQNLTAVVKMAGVSDRPVWTHDGSHLLFVSNRSGQPAMWSVPVQDGRASGDPVLVRSDGALPIVVTRSGELFYMRIDGSGAGQYVFIAERESAGPRVTKSFIGEGVSWSPDGRSLAYIRNAANGNAVMIRSIDTGEERAYPIDGLGLEQLRWMPDGSGVVAHVPGERNGPTPGGSLYFVNATTGAYRRLVPRNTTEHIRSGVVDVSRDGRTLYMPFRKSDTGPFVGIVAVDLETLTEKLLVTFPQPGYQRDGLGLSVSPDGTRLAVQAWAEPRQQARLLTVRTDGTGFRELHGPFAATNTWSNVRWTPDSRSILFFITPADGQWRLMRISADGGQPVFEGLEFSKVSAMVSDPPLSAQSPMSLDVSPDGSQIAFAGFRRRPWELWAIENVHSQLSAHR